MTIVAAAEGHEVLATLDLRAVRPVCASAIDAASMLAANRIPAVAYSVLIVSCLGFESGA